MSGDARAGDTGAGEGPAGGRAASASHGGAVMAAGSDSGQPAGSGAEGSAARLEVTIPGDHGLEGVLEWPESGEVLGGVVVAHPHPLYGGTMRQPVVHHLARACRRKGLATLRFNFRGVGASAGSYSGLEEFHDVRAAAAFLRAQLPAGLPVSLAGYSFGSWMTALAAIDGESAAALALVAFPVDWDEFSPVFFERLGEFSGPVIAVCAEFDTISPPADAEAFLRGVGLDPQLVVVAGVDHFFTGAGEQVGEPAADFLLRASVERMR